MWAQILEEGVRVGVPGRAYQPCGTCYECRNNDGDPAGYGVCFPRAGNLGLSSDDGFEEHAFADSRQVAPIPAPLKAVDTAPLMCAGLTVWNALETADIDMTDASSNRGKTVAVIGAGGGLGHLGVQFAAKLGCKVIAVDTSDKALDMLRGIVDDLGSIGKQVSIVNATAEEAEDVRIAVCGQPEASLEGEKGADACLILPESQQALDYGLTLLRSHSTCVLVSFPIDGFHFNPRDIVFRHIRMLGVLVGRNRQLRAMLEFAAANNVRAKTTTYKLEEFNDLVGAYNQGASGKLVVDLTL